MRPVHLLVSLALIVTLGSAAMAQSPAARSGHPRVVKGRALGQQLSPKAAADAPGTPARWVNGIPDVSQMNSYTCGVACVQSVAQRYANWGYQSDWAEELGTTAEQGTHPQRIVACLRRLGLDATLVEGMTLDQLRKHVDQGHAVIVDYQAWADPGRKVTDYTNEWEDGHYSIAVGYSATHVFIEDPVLLGTTGTLTNADFMARWHDYEIENGQRREYRQMAIVVTTPAPLQPRFTPIE